MKGQRQNSFVLVLSSLALLVMLVVGTWGTAYAVPGSQPAAFITPTISIVSVVTDQTVTIRTYNYPANDSFTVLMNVIHTQGIGGYEVGTLDSGAGGSITATFNIPDELKGQQQIAIRLESPTSGYFSYNWFWNNTSGIPVSGDGQIPNFYINSVVPDQSVTISTASTFPANQSYNVLMGKYGTLGVGGINVGNFDSGSGGTFAKTFTIPNELKGQQRIAIRLESTTTDFFAYNWFWNTSSSGIPISGGGIPTFSIQSVVTDQTVTIKTNNFPANDTFEVRMGFIGTRGINGILVDTIQSGSGGVMTMTFDIPAELQGQRQIAIRLESPASRYFAYNWFYNNTTNGGGIPNTGTLPPGVIPTISITSVAQDSTVKFQTHNYPANDHFIVLMNVMHTQGIGGTQVAEFDSGNGGSFAETVNIPDNLKGQRQIAIRVYSPTSGYFSYNWFWNSTAP